VRGDEEQQQKGERERDDGEERMDEDMLADDAFSGRSRKWRVSAAT
jgi:hypothetical protein